MKLFLLSITLLIACTTVFAQQPTDNRFKAAYENYPLVTPGVLEAVSWTNTHLVHLENNTPSCSGMPLAFGIMGLYENGKNYFIETASLVAKISGVSIEDQKASSENQILAYAEAYNHFMSIEVSQGGTMNNGNSIKNVLQQLTEIPDSGSVNLLARDMQAYSILRFLNSSEKAVLHGFPLHTIAMQKVFGEANLNVLSSKKVVFGSDFIQSESGVDYIPQQAKSLEYGPAIWNPAPSCNYSSRSGTAISAITIHTIQGSYAGAISWSQNCSSNVSFHYVIRSSDGQVTQMLLEADKGWHVGTENTYTIGYEHEGYVSDPSWYTEQMYNSSADLSRDIVGSGYGIPPLRTYYEASTSGTNLLGGCTKIKGHQHYPNQTHTDPGINWDWEKYYKLINNLPTYNLISATSGTLYDTGGPSSTYQDDERELWLIQPNAALNVSVNFSAFDLEVGYDNMFIYDGNNPDAPLIGTYTGISSPGTITSTGPALLIEFRSDCGTVAGGWEATFSSTVGDQNPPLTSIQADAIWHTDDFTVDFTDSDLESGLAKQFYQIIHKDINDNGWTANTAYGFLNEDFEDNSINWTNQTGNYSLNTGTFDFADDLEQNSNSFASLTQDSTNEYLYEWDQNFTSTSISQRAGLHFFCDDATLPNRGNSYFVCLRESDDLVQIFKVTNDVFQLYANDTLTIDDNTWYNCKVTYSPTNGSIKLYVNDQLATQWQDPTPFTTGNSVSFRTGGCATSFDDFHVYQSRGSQITIPAGFTEAMSFESENAIESGRVNSIVIDSAENWSLISMEDYLLDFSTPTLTNLNDGISADIDTFFTSTLAANWDIDDIHSGIGDFSYAIGTLPNLDDIAPWTTNGIANTLSHILASPIINEVYHVSVRATNNASLDVNFTSNGQRYVEVDSSASIYELFSSITLFPNPSIDNLVIDGVPTGSQLVIYDELGRVCIQKDVDQQINLDVSNLSDGTYHVLIQHGSAFVIKQLIVQH